MHALLVPIRDEQRRAAARRPDRGLRRQARPQRRRQRAHLVRPRARPAREPARPLRAGRAEDGTYFSPIENPTKRFFTMLGTLIQGRDQRLRRVDQRVEGGADDRRPARARAAPVRRRPAPSEEALLMDYRTHQRRLLPGAGQDVRAVVRPAAARRRAARGVHRPRTRRTATRRELETLAAGVKAIATWHATRRRSRAAARRAAAPATCARTASRR